ncbi:hypothetical protein Q1695_007167 [Nippostrongylus brasiliensis]|nr:hypothetical protein Q1695_007167 [Nippostrongylus brasiliensis]
MPSSNLDDFIEDLRDKINNKKWWTSRCLRAMEKSTEIPRETLAKVIAGLISVICAVTEQARVCCNAILIIFPLISTFGYPEEAPPKDDMVLYWALFGVLTLGDKELEKIPLYYDLKLTLALLLFIEPFRLIDKLREAVYGKNEKASRIFKKDEMDAMQKKKHSPRPEKPTSHSAEETTTLAK